jgi:hypothetical protein
VRAAVETVDGVFVIDVDEDAIVEAGAELEAPAAVELRLPRLVSAARVGSTIVAVVDRRPPLVVSHDAGRTWREAGGGLPPGRAVAVAEDNPDLVLFAARNRLYVSRDGGRFWSGLTPELPEIQAVGFV